MAEKPKTRRYMGKTEDQRRISTQGSKPRTYGVRGVTTSRTPSGRRRVTVKNANSATVSETYTPPKRRSTKSVSGDYRGRNQPRRQPAKPAKGLSKAMQNTQRGRKAWN